ncbi:family 78 glycoside hydrolase catalytic domain [Bacteroides sp.]
MKKILVLSLYGLLLSFYGYGKEKCYPVDLRCEHLSRPLGMDEKEPRLSWRVSDKRQDAMQTAYQVTVGLDSLSLLKDEGILWSEEKKSNNTLIRYAGDSLKPFTKYYWCVSIWDKDGKKSSKAISSFETGMIGQQNWKGTFISDGKDVEDRSTPCFRKKVNIRKKIKSARVYVTAAGLYELAINGKKIGDHVLDPAYTDFAKRLLYITYDVTGNLSQGENMLGVLLGNGWYNHQPVAEWNFHQADWRGRPSFRLNLRIVYSDGTEEWIASDRSFETTASPITFNAVYLGEGYDFRKDNKEVYASLSSEQLNWKPAVEIESPTEKIVAQSMPPIRVTKKLRAKSMTKFSDTNYVFDFGQNWSGVIDGIFKGEKDARVKIKYTEGLDEKKEHVYDDCLTGFYTDRRYGKHPEDEQFQTDVIYLDGEKNHFTPRFSYKGFQYVEVTSDRPLKLNKGSLTSCFMHTDVPDIASFECSNPLFNKIMRATRYSYLSNLIGIPTDCPQREKNGWTGDAHLAIETGLYNYDAITFYEKWMRDFQDNLFGEGRLACIIPSGGWGQTDNTVDWSCAVAIIPWTIYEFYGDDTCLRENYEMMKTHADFFLKHYPTGLVDACLGDWCPYKSVSNKELTASICFYRMVDIIAKAARLFNQEDDLLFYRKMANKIKMAINDKFLNEETGVYGSGYQAELSMPLRWNIVPEHCRSKVAARLSERVKQDNDHLDVGIFGCQALLDALTVTGNVEQAYKVANQKDEPSWGNWIERGSTTLHEWWKSYDDEGRPVTSHNHIMFGEIGAWLYKTLGGIKPDSACPGFKNIILKPYFMKDISYVNVSYNTPQGMVKSSWNRKGEKVVYKVTVPPNATATLFLQDDEPVNLKSGTFTFEVTQ